MTTTPAMPEPFAWAWRNKVTGAKGVYFEDPKPFGITSHPDYEWTNLYTEAQALATLQAQPAEVSDAEIDAAWVKNGGGLNSNNYRAFARAILALRPQAVPMTDEVLSVLQAIHRRPSDVGIWLDDLTRIIRATRETPTPTPPKHAPKLIGWRTENFLWETDDADKARNWEPNIGVLPIFEGDPNTKLGSHGITAPAGWEKQA